MIAVTILPLCQIKARHKRRENHYVRLDPKVTWEHFGKILEISFVFLNWKNVFMYLNEAELMRWCEDHPYRFRSQIPSGFTRSTVVCVMQELPVTSMKHKITIGGIVNHFIHLSMKTWCLCRTDRTVAMMVHSRIVLLWTAWGHFFIWMNLHDPVFMSDSLVVSVTFLYVIEQISQVSHACHALVAWQHLYYYSILYRHLTDIDDGLVWRSCPLHDYFYSKLQTDDSIITFLTNPFFLQRVADRDLKLSHLLGLCAYDDNVKYLSDPRAILNPSQESSDFLHYLLCQRMDEMIVSTILLADFHDKLQSVLEIVQHFVNIIHHPRLMRSHNLTECLFFYSSIIFQMIDAFFFFETRWNGNHHHVNPSSSWFGLLLRSVFPFPLHIYDCLSKSCYHLGSSINRQWWDSDR